MLEAKLPTRLIIRNQTNGGLITGCLDQETTRIVHIQGIFMFNIFQGHLTLDIRSVIMQ
jgi:hypothetical protein